MDFARCYACMEPLPGAGAVCPKCGKSNEDTALKQPKRALSCGSMLHGRYILGRVLGQGGFGISYIGFDLALELRLCIKEYFPESGAMRSASQGGCLYWGESENALALKAGRESFVKEARKAVKLQDIGSVVKVWDVFYENETAYIVMDFIEGDTLKNSLLQKGKPLGAAECVRLLTPVMRDLDAVHKRGIIHRDISPDNLMLQPDGTVKLLDLGAAKDLSGSNAGQASALVAKRGFSPTEQYVTGGRIGPWTDVYAMCATIAYCVTGKLLPIPLERMNGAAIDLSAFPSGVARVLEQGLVVQPEKRIQSMQELADKLDASLRAPVSLREKSYLAAKDLMARGDADSLKMAQDMLAGLGPYRDAMALAEECRRRRALLRQGAATPTAELPQQSARVPVSATQSSRFQVAGTQPSYFQSAGTQPSRLQPTGPSRTPSRSLRVLRPDPVVPDSRNGFGRLCPVFGSGLTREQIISVRFQSSLAGMPAGAWDVSERRDGSVLAWAAPKGRLYELTIAAQGWISAPLNCAGMFCGYENLTLLSFNNAFRFEGVQRTDFMFARCGSLTALDVSFWDMSQVTNMSQMFARCGSLSTLDVSRWNTARAVDMSFLFLFCGRLSALDVSRWNTAAVRNMSGLFFGCRLVKELNLLGWNTANVTDMSSMFCSCLALQVLDLRSFQTSRVVNMSSMFSGCTSLIAVILNTWDTASVTDMREMFFNCRMLGSVYVESWNTANVSCMDNMFAGCTSLRRLDVSRWNVSRVGRCVNFMPDALNPNWRSMFRM